jgi:hypothetical protein
MQGSQRTLFLLERVRFQRIEYVSRIEYASAGTGVADSSPEHDLFVRAARVELAPDRLPSPTFSVPQPTTLHVPTAPPELGVITALVE